MKLLNNEYISQVLLI